MDSTAGKPDPKKIDVPPYSLMYAANLDVPPGDPRCKTEMKGFPSWWRMMWFALTDPVARAAVAVGRVRFIGSADNPSS